MDVSQFDPAMFLEATLTEPTVRRDPLPAGEYHATIGQVTARAWTSKKDSTKSGIAWDIPLEVEVPEDVKLALGLDKDTLTFKDSIMLDLTPNGMLDNGPGKNRRMRIYREAVDMNKPGDSFSAARMFGQPILVKIAHEIYEGNTVEKIAGVAKV